MSALFMYPYFQMFGDFYLEVFEVAEVIMFSIVYICSYGIICGYSNFGNFKAIDLLLKAYISPYFWSSSFYFLNVSEVKST